jgi:ubiquinone biosynthesis monooxygenase Coq7
MRYYSFCDQLCLKADHFLRLLSGHLNPEQQARPTPAHDIPEAALTTTQKNHIAGLMRVNYTGEICAQALYQGQGFTTKNQTLKKTLDQAALEEIDHLYWCQSRLHALNSRASLLNFIWYIGSFLLGMTAGLCGDKWNLGFVEETEKQVMKHLDSHLDDLPVEDQKTRIILEKMRQEEAGHAQTAHTAGAQALPYPVKLFMSATAKLMTKTAYWI